MDHLHLQLAARELDGGNVPLHPAKAEPLGDGFPRQRQGWHAIARGAAQRRDVHLLVRQAQHVEVGGKEFGKAQRPEAGRRRHGPLKVRVAGHQEVVVAGSQIAELIGQGERLSGQ